MQRLGLAMILVVVGCGRFIAPIPEPKSEAPPTAPTEAQDSSTAQPRETGPTEAQPDPPASSTNPSPGCKVGFQKDVMPRLVASCAQASCHSDEIIRPLIDASSPQQTHAELMEFEFGSIEWSDPHSEYSGASDGDFKKAIDAWRLCGAKND